MRRNIDESVLIAPSLQQKYHTTAGSPYAGTGVDTQDFEDIVVMYNAATHVAGSLVDIKLQHSDDNSTFSDISGAAFAQVSTSNDETTYLAVIKPGSTKRYIRAHATVTTADANLGVFLICNGRLPIVAQDFATSFTIS